MSDQSVSAGVSFVDVTDSSGFSGTIVGNTGASAWGDFNGDGLPDLWQGNHHAYPPMLWLNQGDGTFVEILQSVMDRPASAYNPRESDYWGDKHGSAWADFDNDGDQDMLVLLGGTGTPSGGEKNQLLENEDGHFVDVSQGKYPKASGRDLAWFDYNRDGRLDYFNTAVERTDASYHAALFRQKQDGTFSNVDLVIGKTTIADFVKSIFLGDVTGDGVLDIITPDHRVLDGATGPQFKTLQTLASPVEARDILIADFNGDLRNDVYSATSDDAKGNSYVNKLFLNGASGLYDATLKSGLGGLDYSTLSAVAGDFDNDMDVDIFLFNGINAKKSDPTPRSLPNVILWNDGHGVFSADEALGAQIGPLDGSPLSVTTADTDRNGFLDLFLDYRDATDRLFKNSGNGNHWIEIDLEGKISNRDGIGSQIFVTAGGKTQMRDATAGTHHEWSQNDKIVHFGLAENATIDKIEIHWTNGIVQTLTDVAADQVLKIVETEGTEQRTGTSSDDRITGDQESNILHGGSGHDLIKGMEGDDSLYGDDGNDTLVGNTGDDLFDGGRGADHFYGGNGFDTVDYSASLPGVRVNIGVGGTGTGGDAEADTYHGIDGIIGTAGDDSLRGNSVGNRISGGNGDDSLSGANGNDVLWGGRGRDLIDGGNGFDYASYAEAAKGVRAQLNGRNGTGEAVGDDFVSVEGLIGSAYADILRGDGGTNRLKGGGGADRIWGGPGHDILQGNLGRDFLVGGTGDDVFLYYHAQDSVRGRSDRIGDFEQGSDVIDLSRIDADVSRGGHQGFELIGSAAFSGVAGELQIRVGEHVTIVRADVDGDHLADLQIVLNGTYDLTASDFRL